MFTTCVPDAVEVRKAFGVPRTGFVDGCEPLWVLAIEARSSLRATSALNQ